MHLFRIAAIAAATLPLAGCHSAWIDATLANRTPGTLTGVELDYPSASFGIQTLAAGHDFHYRFKVLGSGPAAILWTDPAHLDHKIAGPTLHENEEGQLTVTIHPSSADWNPHLQTR